MNSNINTQKPARMSAANKRFYIVLAAIAIILLGWFLWWQFGPRPLGDGLEFLGKRDYGSILPMSSQRPGSSYYYGTNMNKDEVKHYFQNAEAKDEYLIGGNLGDKNILSYDISYENNYQQVFVATYYEDGQTVEEYDNLNTDKKHIVKIDASVYDIARNSLGN